MIEGDETFTVTLSDPVNAIVSSTEGTATGTITDDDQLLSPITITAIDDFTDRPSIRHFIPVSATHSGGEKMQYRAELVGRAPNRVIVSPSEATDLVSGTSQVTITNFRRFPGTVQVRVIVSAGTDRAEELFTATLTHAVEPLKPENLVAHRGMRRWSCSGRTAAS